MTTEVRTEHVWQLLGTRLGHFIRARVENDEVAADLLQETFLRIHQKLHTLDDGDRIEAWVFRIARHLIADHYRTRGPSLPSLPQEPAPDPDSENINSTVSSWLLDALNELPDSYREAVRLYEIEGMPQKEIAQRIGLSLPGAKSRIQRGRERLKQVLDQCCALELDRRGNVLTWKAREETACGCSDACPETR